MMKKARFFLVTLLVVTIGVLLSSSLRAQTLANPYTVTTFPSTISNFNSSGGETAVGMQGACFTLPCCSVKVVKVTLPSSGVLRVEMTNFTPLAGTIIAYRPLVPNPTSYSDLAYIAGTPGNFCGFRDTLQLGKGTNAWDNVPFGQSPGLNGQLTSIYDFNAPSHAAGFFPAGDYYLLVFNENQQINFGIGVSTDLTFEFVENCSPLDTPASLTSDTLEPLAETDTLSFYIKNTRQLTTAIDSLNITGVGSAHFSILTNPAPSLAVGDSTLMEILFAPTTGGVKNATVELSFSDTVCSATSSVDLTGNAREAIIKIMPNNGTDNSISYNSMSFSSSFDTEFGSTPINGGKITNDFFLINEGNDTLEFGNNPVIQIQTNTGRFSIPKQITTTTLLPGDTAIFEIAFEPLVLGYDTAKLTIVNNDDDQTPFNFRVRGFGAGRNALDFDGNGDYLTINRVRDEIHGSTAFTVETWVRLDPAQSGNDVLLGVNKQSNNGTVMFIKVDDGKLEFDVGSSSKVIYNQDVRDGLWHHWAFIFDNGTLQFMLDGEVVSTITSNIPSLASNDKWSIGQEFDGTSTPSDFFNGTLNEFRIWRVARTPQEIRNARYCEIANPGPDLVGYFTFNQGIAGGDNTAIVSSVQGESIYERVGAMFGFSKTGNTSNFISDTIVGTNCTSFYEKVCDSDTYTSPSGKIYDSTGLYLDTLTNYLGGDSVLYIDLAIGYTSYPVDVIGDTTVCGSDNITYALGSTQLVSTLNITKSDQHWVEINEVADSLVNTNRSIFMWMRAAGQVNSSNQVLIGINASGTSTVSNFGIRTNEQLWIYDGGNNRNSGVTVTDGNWHHVGYTYDEGSNSTQFWVDGVEAASFSNGQSISASSRISIGQEFDGSTTSNFFDGEIAEVSFWKEVLDSTDVATIMHAAIQQDHPKYNNLVAYYPGHVDCDDDSKLVRDYGPNGLHGIASENSIINRDSLVLITGFDATSHFTGSASFGGSAVATGNPFTISNPSSGTYETTLKRAHFGIVDQFNVSLSPAPAADIIQGDTALLSADSLLLSVNAQSNVDYYWYRGLTKDWHLLGQDGFSPGSARGMQMDIAPNGDPYVGFRDGASGDAATVMKLTNGTWELVGNNAFSPGAIKDLDFKVAPNGTPYIAFVDQANGNKATVMSYDGSSWQIVGTAGLSAGQATDISLAVAANGDVHISYRDSGNSNKATVQRYNGTTWQPIGTAGFTAGVTTAGEIGFAPDGTLYYVFGDFTNASRATVMSYNGTSWQIVGNAGFSDPSASRTNHIIFDNNGVPHVGVLTGTGNPFIVSAWKLNGSTWQQIGTSLPNTSNTPGNIIAFSPNGTLHIQHADPNVSGKKGTIRKFDGTQWQVVGSSHFTPNEPISQNLGFSPDGRPLFVFSNPVNTNGVSFRGSARYYGLEYVGSGSSVYVSDTAHYVLRALAQGGCVASDTIFVDTVITTALIASITKDTDVSCNSLTDGGATASATGGTSPYTYAWNNGATTASITGVGAGTYVVTITDNDGTTDTASVNITEPVALVASANVDANISAFGLSDGGATASASGGTSPYTYAWSNGATIASITGLVAATYTVTITDNNGCTSSTSATITQPSNYQVSAVVDSNATCNGFTDGGATASVTGGTAPDAYAWSNGATTASINGVGAGTYTVTITDNDGTTGSASVTITQPTALVASSTVNSNVSCYGAADGSVTLNASGGSGGYAFVWSSIGTSSTENNLTAGTYTITAYDGTCSTTLNVTVTEPDSLSISTTNGVSNINASVTGGTAPYNYLWSNGSTVANITGLSAGTYTITTSDANGCTNSTSVSVVGNLVASITSANISCNGNTDGSATASISGGTAPYSYLWSNGAVNTTIGGLSAGTYTVTITDNGGITSTSSTTITEPTVLVASIATDANATCNGATDGGATASATGGTTPYNYSWSNGQSVASITSVGAGTYKVTITDDKGCTVIDSVAITEPAAVAVSNAIIKPDCGISNGDVDITISSTNAPYTYVWSTGATTEDITSVSSGTYTVTITDNSSCTGVFNYNVNNAGTLASTSSTTDITCNGDADGSINANTIGGTAPYSFAWSNGSTTQNISSLSAGVYTLTVTDGIGCLFILTDTVTEPDELMGDLAAFATAITPVSCPGGSDGAISLPIIGGTTPYSYAWSTSATTQTITGLAAGSYFATVTDANGCTVGGPLAVPEQNPMVTSVNTVTDATDYNTTDGSLNVTVSGGTAPFSYSWSNSATTDNISSLPVGPYTITVTDNNGCTTEDYGYIGVLPHACQTTLDWEKLGADEALTLNSYETKGITVDLGFIKSGGASNDDNFSFEHGTRGNIGNVGFIQLDLDASSKNDPNQFSQLEVNFSSPVRNLEFALTDIDASSTYADSAMVAAYDQNGDVVKGYFSFVGDSIDFNFNSDTLRAVGVGNSGNSESFGNAEFVFPDTVSKLIITHYTGQSGSADPGSHRIYLSGLTFENDYQGVYDDYVSVREGDSTVIGVLTNDDLSCFIPHTPSIIASPSNGTASLLSNDNIGYKPDEKFFGIDSLQYKVCDNNGSCDSAWVFVSVLPQQIDSLSWALNNSDESQATDSMFVYSNKVNFTYNDPASIDDGGNFTIESSSIKGLYSPASYLELDINANSTTTANEYVEVTMDFEEQVNGLYFQLIDIDNSSSGGGVDSVIVSGIDHNGQPVPVYLYDMGTHTTAFKAGATRVFYGINESSSSSEGFANVGVFIPDSVEKVIVKYDPPYTSDGDGNPASQSSWIGNIYWRKPLSQLLVANGATTINHNDTVPSTTDSTDFGTVFLGDSLHVTYTLVNTGNDTLIINNPVTITGASNFTVATAQVDNVLPGDSTNLVIKYKPTTSGLEDAMVSISSNDICQPNYVYSLTANAACPNYTASAFIDSNVTCNGLIDGGATAAAAGGTMPYTYVWSNGATTASISGVAAGVYMVTVTDAFGCSDTSAVTITEPAVLAAASVVDSNVTCNGFTDGGATSSATGGTMPYTYAWSSGATTASISGVPAGSYTVTITDNNGCTATSSATVTEPAVLVAASVVDSNATCNGFTDGGATASATGGTMPYTYNWNNGATTASITGVAAGTYSVTITDNNRCFDSTSVTITEPVALTALSVVDSNVTCNGLTDGGATGGTIPYTYAWNNGATTAAITGVAAGTYSITITDNNGCFDSTSITITEPAVLNAAAVVDSNVTCNGFANGGATAAATGGTMPYSYAWSNGATTAAISGVVAGTYSITITDHNGCFDSTSIAITEPAVLTLNVVVDSNESCTGAANGGLSTQVTGGTMPYSYAWSNSGTTDSNSGLAAGIYTVTVEDANGCSITGFDTIKLQDVSAPTVVTRNIFAYLDQNGQTTITAAQLDSASFDACGIDTISLNTYSFTCADTGANTVTLYVTDVNANTDSATAAVTVMDTIAPTVITQNITVYLDANGQASITTADVNNGSTDNCSIQSITLDSTNFDCSEVGANTVTLSITDVNANTGSATATVTVMDTLAPTVNTQNITVYLDANGQASITPADVDNGSTDNCTIQSMALDSSSFDCSEVGANTVTLYVTDVNANIDSATATVTVLDTLTPTVNTQNITVYLDANGQASITPADVDNGSTDNCTIQSMALDSSSFDCSEVGANTVTLYVTDVNANIDSTTATVTVLDTLTPTVNTQNITVYLDANGQASIAPADVDNGSTDNCTIQSMALDSSSFDCSEVGANTVTLYVTDVNANIDSATATVTVLDTVSPIVNTQNITVYLGANGQASITTADIDNASTDNCSIQSIALDSTNFDCSEVGANTVTLSVTDVNANTTLATAIVTVLDTIAPTLVVGLDSAICATDTSGAVYNYSVSGSDNCSTGGIVQTDGLPSGSTFPIGTTTNVFELTDASGNVTRDSFDITVYGLPALSFDTIEVLCETDSAITLNAIPAGGTFSGPGITGNTFDPTAVPSGVTTVTYTYTTVNGCTYSAEQHAQVRLNPSVLLGDFADTICLEQSVVACPVGTPSGGIYSGPGIDNVVLRTEVAGIGDHYISYTYTDKYGCTSSDSSLAEIRQCYETVGFEDLNRGIYNISVYPNPNRGRFTIEHEGIKPITCSIFSAQGTLIEQVEITTKQEEISIEQHAKGIYLIRITGDNINEQRQIIVH